jgi:hypothetical protein
MSIIDPSKFRAVSGEASCDILKQATGSPPFSSTLIPRRQLLEAAGTVVAGAAAALLDPHEASANSILTEYFSILATGEALFVTFYSNVVANREILGLHAGALNALEAILTEEQIHYNFAVANGGMPATTHFSFPHGKDTFGDRGTFLATQQLSEELTNGALLAWIIDMAKMGQPRLAQIGGQLMQVEGGHRVVGRVLLDAEPWDNWAFGPVAPLKSFLQVPDAVKAAGFLNPRPGNDFIFHPASATFPGVIHKSPNS